MRVPRTRRRAVILGAPEASRTFRVSLGGHAGIQSGCTKVQLVAASEKGYRRIGANEVTGPVRIAVVDDDESVRESLLGLVDSIGYDVTVFSSAEEFLNLNHQDRFACLILDMRLPGMSGLELYSRLKTDDKLIPTVFITAHADMAVQSRALSEGAEAFLYKPFKPEILLDAVRAAVQKSVP